MTEFKNDKYFVRKTIVYYDELQYVEKELLDTFEPVTNRAKILRIGEQFLILKPVSIVVQNTVRFIELMKLLTLLRRCILIADVILYHWNRLKLVMQPKITMREQIIGLNILVNCQNIMLLRIKPKASDGVKENHHQIIFPEK